MVIWLFTVANAASTLLEEFERVPLFAACAVMAPFTPAIAASMLDDELEMELELTLIAARAASTLDDEFERLKLEVCAVEIAAFVIPNAVSVVNEEFERVREEVCAVVIATFNAPRVASVLDEEFEIEFELALMAARAASKLEEEVER